jgi:hypothetical protein
MTITEALPGCDPRTDGDQGGVKSLHSRGRILRVAWSGILALVILAFGQGVWAGLLFINLRTSPAIPWAVPVMSLILWLMWQYLGGKWWPRGT